MSTSRTARSATATAATARRSCSSTASASMAICGGTPRRAWREAIGASPQTRRGPHSIPLNPDADLSLPGMARITADFLEALDLDGVAIVANDTGGAVAQALVGRHPERIARLVLTSCDAFEKFPPTPQKYLEVMARSRLLTWIVAYTARFKTIQRLPTAYGLVTSRAMPPDIMRSFTGPVRLNPGVRRDFRRMLRAVDPNTRSRPRPSSPASTSRRWCSGAKMTRSSPRPRKTAGTTVAARAIRADRRQSHLHSRGPARPPRHRDRGVPCRARRPANGHPGLTPRKGRRA